MKTINKFLFFTFLLSYLVWGIVFAAQELGWFAYGTPLSLLLVIVGANSPAIMSFLVFRKQQKHYTLRQFFMEAFHLKQPVRFYLLTMLFIAIFFGIPALMGGVSGQLNPFAGGTNAGTTVPLWITIPVIPLFFFLGGSEEIGWRHFLQPELEKHLPFSLATALTALIWDLWHLPLFFIIGTSQNSSDLVSFSVYIIGMSFALAVIHHLSNSAWLCVFFHCATNALQGSWPLLDDYLIKTVTAFVMVAAALGILYIGRQKSSVMIRPEKHVSNIE